MRESSKRPQYTNGTPGPFTAVCRYCNESFTYYDWKDKPINCMKTSCIEQAKRDGVYKIFKTISSGNNDPKGS
jgi:hypothetical protein